jgi:hypothetical protein
MKRERVPIIILDQNSSFGHKLLQINDWQGDSKFIVQTCIAQLNLLNYAINNLNNYIDSGIPQKISEMLTTLNQQWKHGKWPIDNCDIYLEIPPFHFMISGIFTTGKAILDLIVQLLRSENIVRADFDGFHKDKKIVGGRVLKMLKDNVSSDKKDISAKLIELITVEKNVWIDTFISARDLLTHPKLGMHQVMLKYTLLEKNDELQINDVIYPSINDIIIFEYANLLMTNISDFIIKFTKAIIVT